MSVLEISAFQEIQALMRDKMSIVVAQYEDAMAKHIAKIESAVLARDKYTVISSSHTLKSSSANLGAQAMAKLCEKIEQASKNDNPAWDEIATMAASMPEIQENTRYAITRALSK